MRRMSACMRASCITTRIGRHEVTSNTPFWNPFGKKGQLSHVEVFDVSSDRTDFILVTWSTLIMLKTPVEETKMSFSWRQSGNLPCTTAMRRRDDIPRWTCEYQN